MDQDRTNDGVQDSEKEGSDYQIDRFFVNDFVAEHIHRDEDGECVDEPALEEFFHPALSKLIHQRSS